MNKYLLIFVGCSLLLSVSPKSRAEIPTKLEPGYSEAVMSYNSKDYGKALKFLDELLKASPEVPEFLELRALSLKNLHDDHASAEAYQALIQVNKAKGQDKADPKKLAPYYYELGLIRFREGQIAPARELLSQAADLDFNRSAAHFFLGLLDFRESKWSESGEHFGAASSSDATELRAAAEFYAGQAALKMSSSSTATQRFYAARNASRDVLDGGATQTGDARKIAQQIFDATEKALQPFDRAGFFGNVALLTGYDSNALSVPGSLLTASADAGDAVSTGTPKQTLLAGAGYSSSPTRRWQFVPSYRLGANLNFTEGARSAEFISQELSLYVTRNALARLSWGARLGFAYMIQDIPQSGSRNFSSYSLTFPFGPYIRYELRPQLALSLEMLLQPASFFQDSDSSPTLKRGGLGTSLRASLRNDRGDRWWNPTYSLVLDRSGTSGSEYNSMGPVFELANQFRVTDELSVTGTMDAGFPRYSDRAEGPRQDRIFAFDLNGTYRLTPKIGLLADAQFINNQSTIVDTYQFNRFNLSAGASYLF